MLCGNLPNTHLWPSPFEISFPLKLLPFEFTSLKNQEANKIILILMTHKPNHRTTQSILILSYSQLIKKTHKPNQFTTHPTL